MTKFDSSGLLNASGFKTDDLLTALGMDDPSKLASGSASRVNLTALQSGQNKLKAGLPLTREEANAVSMARAANETMDKVGKALQPLQFLSDITKGIVGQVKGPAPSIEGVVTGTNNRNDAFQRGLKAAAGHLTYGLAEKLPGMAGARANGVSGMELLKGTKYANDPLAALAVEVFADPSILLTGAGIIAKTGSTAGRLASLEKLASTPEGAAKIRAILTAADTRGNALLRAGDEITGIPSVVRGVAKTKPVQAAKTAAGKAADVQLPDNWVTAPIKREGGGTYGDAFLTPDQKAAIYTPEQLARDAFRTDTRATLDDLGKGIKDAANVDAKVAANLTRGLKVEDASEANRLLGVFTTTTKPEVAAEALRKLQALSKQVGRNLEPAFVEAVKASDRVGQVTLGRNLEAQGLPVVLAPEVTKAIQEAKTGPELVAQVGKYTTQDGRPRGILMTQYVGRNDPTSVIQKLIEGPEIPAAAKVDEAQLGQTLKASTEGIKLPPKPVEPLGTPPVRNEPPVNSADTATAVTRGDVTYSDPVTTPKLTEARQAVPAPEVAPTPAPKKYTPQEVLDNLFTGRTAEKSNLTFPRAADDVTPTPVREAAPAPRAEAAPTDYTPPARTPAQVIDELMNPPTPARTLVQVGDEFNPDAGILLADRGGQLKSKPVKFSMYDDNTGIAVADGSYGVIAERGANLAKAPESAPAQFQEIASRADVPTAPVAIHGGAENRVWFDNAVSVRADHFDDLTKRFPNATFQANEGKNYIVAFDEGRPVGYLSGDYDRAATPPRNFQAMQSAPVAPRSPEPTLPLTDELPSPAPTLNTQIPASAAQPKTPQQVIQDILNPEPRDPYVGLPDQRFTPTPQAERADVALPRPEPETTVLKRVPTTYQTVQVDANALDWAALPDDAARRAVLNSIEDAGNGKFVWDAQGNVRLDRPNITVPLGHPTVSRYFSDDEIMAAQRQGTDFGERTITRKENVPNWYDPKDAAPLDVQRAMREQALKDAQDAAYPNDLGHIQNVHDLHDDTAWIIGDAFASFDRLPKPRGLQVTREAANEYAARVKALTGTPPTKGEVFQYRLALARYRQAANLKNMDAGAVAKHLKDFYETNPEATLFEGIVNAAREFDLGRGGIKHLQNVMRQAESGFERSLSTLERKEFAQYLLGRDATRRGAPGGTLVNRLKRNPETVSEEFQQVFAQDVNALKVMDEQVRTRTAAIVRSERFGQYRAYLEESGQLITQQRLTRLRMTPEHRLTAEERVMRTNAANAITRGGSHAGWKVMDRNVEGYFQKGDVVPWWAYFDLFGASKVEDAAVSASILGRGGLDVYNRAWSSMNAQMLGTPSSIINDQIGQTLQMVMWGVTPDAFIEGVIRRATASPAELNAMRASGIQSAKLESNLGSDMDTLTRLAQRLDGDTDLSRTERVIDAVLRFRERGTGLNPQAMTGVAGVAADVAHLGSGYLFQFRSRLSDLQREALYFHRTALGDTSAQAAKYANTVMLDMRLVPAYARVVRKFWPFFNWIAMSGPRSIVTVLRKPGISAAYHRLGPASSDRSDPRENARRQLARDGGYVNMGVDERNGARLYLDPRNWDPTNTIPQLMDWSGTKVGAVGLPWYANLVVTLQWGQDRFGRNIYDPILNGSNGGFTEAYKADPSKTLKAAATAVYQQFNPSYAPGSPRAQAFVRSVLATAKLPEDGSKDITIARSLAGTPQGRAFLVYMQNGNLAAIDHTLLGTRESEYTTAAPSMFRSLSNFLFPVRGVQGDQRQQGDALQKLAVGKLQFQSWLAQQKKTLEQMEAAGASKAEITAKENEIEREASKKAGQLDYLDMVTR